jgi:hypothetical protein
LNAKLASICKTRVKIELSKDEKELQL